MPKAVDQGIRAFGMSGYQVSDDLNQIEKQFAIELGHLSKSVDGQTKDAIRLFESKVQAEATEMANHYKLFYCLEKSIRQLISNILAESAGVNWWETNCVPTHVKDEVKRRRKDELDSGVTPRSDDPIDFTTFGELEVIITNNWKAFEAVFDSQRAVQSVIKRLNVLRGPIAHCCPYSEDEKERLQLTVRDWIRLL
jgi:Swt1-like HEPN